MYFYDILTKIIEIYDKFINKLKNFNNFNDFNKFNDFNANDTYLILNI